jgi:phospholipid/cholesterol/gamma-HCH transport system ATP-binding protein
MARMISAENLHKAFDGVGVLNGASLEVERGEAVALIGRSGDGKSVFLKHVAGLFRPDSGRVVIDGQDLNSASGRELRRLRTRFGFLFQGGALFQSMTVYDNIAFPLREKTHMGEGEIRERVTEELERVGLEGSEEKYPAQISGGMVKRAALARSLVQSPEIMLFDEPTTGLDPLIARAIHDLIQTVRQSLSLTAIIVTHEIPHVFDIVERVALLHEGSIRFEGTPDELMSSEDPVVREFLGATIPETWQQMKNSNNHGKDKDAR